MTTRGFLLFISLILVSCRTPEDSYSRTLHGDWQIVKFLQGTKDYSLKDNYIMSFSPPAKLWIHNVNHETEVSFNVNYEFSLNEDKPVIDITDSPNNFIDGNYNVYMDTLQDDGESYLIRLTLDSENTYFQAIRNKLKYNSYEEYVEKTGGKSQSGF